MANKNTPLRVIDMATAQNGSEGGVPVASTPLTTLAPRIDLIPGPTGLTISGQTTYRSTAAPQIAVRINWYPAPVYRFDYFIVEYDTNSSFTAPERVQTFQQNVTLVLKPSTTYYVRVSAAYEQVMSQWSSTLTVATITDLTVPTAPGSLTLDWYRGDLYIVSPITNTDLVKDIRIQIWNAANTVQLDEVYSAAPYLFTAEENRRVNSGIPTPTVVVKVHSRGWNNVISASGIQQSTTSPAPGTITGLTTNWASDTGTESADCIVTWGTDPQSSAYVVQFNNDAAQVFNVLDGRYTYTWNQNAKAFPPSGMYTMPVRVWGVNKLAQSGVAATVTHTNAAPTATGATLVAFSGFSQIIGQLTHAQINDVLQYRYSLVPASGTAVVYTSDSREVTLPIPSAGLWTLRANIIDRFGRASSNIDSSQFFSDTLTISGLRSAAVYRDRQGTNPNILNGLKDNILTTSIVAHNNTTAGSRWTEFSRPFVERYRSTTLTTSGAMRFFLVAFNGENITKYYGAPLTGTYGNTLTEYASLALAQTNYVTHSGAITRYDLPDIMEARTITMYHWTAAGSYGLAEFYPRRLVQSDDLEAESIKSINIAAGNVTADKIFVLNLAAINIATGNLTISGVLTIASGTGSGLYQGTGTFTSPTTGLKIWRDTGGIGRLTTYSGAIVQVDVATDGSLLAGAGNVILNKNGVQILSQSTTNAGTNAVSWFQTDPSNDVSTMYSYRSGGQNAFYIESAANVASNQGGFVSILGIGASRTSFLSLKGNNVSGNDTTAESTLYSYRINLWGPASSSIYADVAYMSVGAAPNVAVRFFVKSANTSASEYAINAQNSAGTNLLYLRNDAGQNASVVAWTITSDRKTKKNIKPLGKGLETILALKPKEYNRKLAPDVLNFGLVAQDVEKIIPEIVDTLDDGTKGIRYSELTPIIIKAIQDLSAEVKELRQNINAKA